MRVLIRTEDHLASERLDRYRDAILRQSVAVESQWPLPPDLHVGIEVSEFGPVAVALVTKRSWEALDTRRTPMLIRRSDPESYRLMVNWSGHNLLAQEGRESALGVGDMALLDTSLPFRVKLLPDDGPEHAFVMITFPRQLLAIDPGAVRTLIGGRLQGQRGLGALVSGFVTRLAHDVDHIDQADGVRLTTSLLDLLALLLARELDVCHVPAQQAHRRILLVQIQEFIQQHLGDPALSPDMIASSHYISTRSLHALFHEHGLTVGGWIRARRLERCRQDLLDPRLRSRPIHAIAARWGFTDAAHFSRTFSAMYGMSPQRYRLQ